MTRSLAANLAMVRRVAERLDGLRDQLVFLGAAAAALLITDSRFLGALSGHLLLDQASQQRTTVLKGRMRRIADLEST